MNLENSKILVAGAGGLLGSHVVAGALQAGAQVVACDIDPIAAESRIKQLGGEECLADLEVHSLDLNEEGAVIDLFANSDGLTGAVNCAYPRGANYGAHFLDVTLEDFNENVSLHLGSAFLFAQQCAKYFLRERKDFSLVNIGSIYGVIAPRFEIYEGTSMTTPVEYAAIKSATIHLNKYIAAYISDSRFRVNSVSPGGVEDGQPEAFQKKYQSYTHGAGMLSVEDIVGSIIFLCSCESKFLTAQNILVDDGFHL